MDISDKTPTRLLQVSLLFSAGSLFISGINLASISLLILFTLTVYVSCRIYMSLRQLKITSAADFSELQTYLQIAGLLFLTIATFAYSYLFGAFYLFIYGIYLISPYDRDWLAGRSEIIYTENKLEYRKTESV